MSQTCSLCHCIENIFRSQRTLKAVQQDHDTTLTVQIKIVKITMRFSRWQHPGNKNATSTFSKFRVMLTFRGPDCYTHYQILLRVTTITVLWGTKLLHWKKEHFSPISAMCKLYTQSLTCHNLFQLSPTILKCNIQVEMFLLFVILEFCVFPYTFKWQRKWVRGNKVEMSRQ